MTTLDARANNAWHAMIAEQEREHPDSWMGFSHERDAWEDGWQTGHDAASADEVGISDSVIWVASAAYNNAGAVSHPAAMEIALLSALTYMRGER